MEKTIIDKIKKCLALANSSNPHEAATALRQAQALMAKHGISGEELELSEVESFAVKAGAGKTPPGWIVALTNLVCRAVGVEVIYSANWNHVNAQWVGKVLFIGINGSPEIAGYTYEVLFRQLQKDRREYLKSLSKKLKPSTKVRRGDLYAEGWVQSVYNLINPQTITEPVTALIEKYKAKSHPNLQEGRSIDRTSKTSRHDESAFFKGKEDGRNATFNQGVGRDHRDALTHQEV